MLARLWWKDARQFWPIWLVLVGSATACQWMLLRYGGQDARHGLLLPVAMGWVLLYGFAVSAAAFAGERENSTLAFLDMLPVSRPVLWKGKASFAVVTTIGLAAFLATMAWLSSDRLLEMLPYQDQYRLGLTEPHTGAPGVATLSLVALGFLAVLLEVIGWGLFWSAVSSNAMIAAVLAMVCSALGIPLIRGAWASDPAGLISSAPWRLALALAASAASAVVLTLGGRPGFSWRALLNRDINVRALRGARERRERAPRWLLSPQVRALIWQTSRALWPVWWRLNAIGFGLPLLFLLTGIGADWSVVVLCNEVLWVAAGVSLFGAENRTGTQRFLAHHGARPGVVWAVKLAVLAAYLLPIWFLLVAFTVLTQGSEQKNQWPLIILIMMTGVAVGQLCGMVIRRGITAGLVAMIGVFAVGLPQIALRNWQMLSWEVPLLVPLVLLAVSWAWSGDWLLERPGLERWGRLALWLTCAFATVFAAHVAERVWGVPDVGPGFDVAAFERAAAVNPKDNAADLYREAARRVEIQQERGTVLRLVQRASTLPRCQFVSLDRVTTLDTDKLTLRNGLYGLTQMLADSARKRRESGDLAGAWDELMVMFRMARHLTGPVPTQEAYVGLDIVERQALGEAMRWSVDPRQTPERVRAALDAYRGLPTMPPVTETIRAESILVRNTLRLPGDDLAALVLESEQKGSANEFEKTTVALHAAALTSPWEVARARRALRLYFRSVGQNAEGDPGARTFRVYLEKGFRYVSSAVVTSQSYHAYELSRLAQTTPLARYLSTGVDTMIDSNDRNEVARRALVQILALRHWQLTHGGKLPKTLFELVESGELRDLPGDPYATRSPFGYVRSNGQLLPPLGRLDPYWPGSDNAELQARSGQWLLYSIGPDRQDGHAYQYLDSRSGIGDLTFPLSDKDVNDK